MKDIDKNALRIYMNHRYPMEEACLTDISYNKKSKGAKSTQKSSEYMDNSVFKMDNTAKRDHS